MNFAPLYSNASQDFQGSMIMDSIIDPGMNMDIGINTNENINNLEPILVSNNLLDNSLKIRENLLNILHDKDIIPIDDEEFKNEEIDSIITKIKTLNKKLSILQDELDECHEKYNDELKKTKENIDKIDCSIQFIQTCNEEYDSNEKIKSIIDSLNEYIETINNNNNLKKAKEDYINKRKTINKHLCLLHAINGLNTSAVCPICITDQIDSYFNPCGHTTCEACFKKNNNISNRNNFNKCPICRENVMNIRKLYLI
jgi:hypothetical protein